jgi:hypothetical protein
MPDEGPHGDLTQDSTPEWIFWLNEAISTPHRLTGEHIVRERFGDERTDFGGPAGNYDQMVSDDATP